MRNPLRSEAAAFHFLLGTIVYFGLIAITSALAGRWAGLAAFALLSAILVARWWRGGHAERTQQTTATPSPAGEQRILVLANETVGGSALRAVIRAQSAPQRTLVLVVVPALNAPVRHWVSDEDAARAAAQARLDASLAALAAEGIDASGEIGDADPLQAAEDALRSFGADTIIISTHPEGRSHWLERSIVTKARERFAVPVAHVVVDLEADRKNALP